MLVLVKKSRAEGRKTRIVAMFHSMPCWATAPSLAEYDGSCTPVNIYGEPVKKKKGTRRQEDWNKIVLEKK